MDFSKHTKGTTSVKVHHAPGGQSNFSLAWDTGDEVPKNKKQQATNQIQESLTIKVGEQQQIAKESEQKPAGRTSVKVHNPPGGKSSIVFG